MVTVEISPPPPIVWQAPSDSASRATDRNGRMLRIGYYFGIAPGMMSTMRCAPESSRISDSPTKRYSTNLGERRQVLQQLRRHVGQRHGFGVGAVDRESHRAWVFVLNRFPKRFRVARGKGTRDERLDRPLNRRREDVSRLCAERARRRCLPARTAGSGRSPVEWPPCSTVATPFPPSGARPRRRPLAP